MIPITPEILGPGIEEEYADAMERIDFLSEAFKDYPRSNDTPHGRVVYMLTWLRQEISAQRLPIPVDRSYIGTLGQVLVDGSLGQGTSKIIYDKLGELIRILQGPGLIKKRHYPVVVAQIEDFQALVAEHVIEADLLPIENQAVEQMADIGQRLKHEEIDLPVSYHDYPAWAKPTSFVHLREPYLPNGGNERNRITLPVFDGWRPYPARKPPMPAPNPGLPPKPPDVTMIRDLIRTKVI